MRSTISRLYALPALFLALCVAYPSPSTGASATNSPLVVMSYNLRYAKGDRGTNSWENRKPLMLELLQRTAPDVIGTQEGLHEQLQELSAGLPDYTWIGTGRDGGNKGEFMAIFYKTARLQPLSTNHFWLSDTPEVVASSTWGNSNKRMVTVVKFHDAASGKEFYHFNTHFDHEVQLAREKSAELVRARVLALNTTLPVILTGDFNAGADNKAHALLVEDGFFSDTWFTAKTRRGDGIGTFNAFKGIPTNNTRIDWILTRGPVTVDEEEILTFSKDGRFPSDHFPLVARLLLGN